MYKLAYINSFVLTCSGGAPHVQSLVINWISVGIQVSFIVVDMDRILKFSFKIFLHSTCQLLLLFFFNIKSYDVMQTNRQQLVQLYAKTDDKNPHVHQIK